MSPTQVAGVLLIDDDGNIIAQHRDERPGLNFPGKATFFGGKVKPGEDVLQAALREASEETNLGLTEGDIVPYLVFDGLTDTDHTMQTYTVYIATGVSTKGLEIYEGQGYHIVKDISDPLIADAVKPLFSKWFAERDAKKAAKGEGND